MTELIMIGGSAGAFNSIIAILQGIDKEIEIPIVIVLHRLKNAASNFESILQKHTHYKVKEIEDKENIQKGVLYTAPANYHVLLELGGTFSLDVSEEVNYSRPSIDVTFESCAITLKEKCLGVLLSGSNSDGANGLKLIALNKGKTIIQDCNEAEFANMPLEAKNIYQNHKEMNVVNIIKTINNESRY